MEMYWKTVLSQNDCANYYFNTKACDYFMFNELLILFFV